MKTDGLDDAFNVETSIVPAEIEKVQKKEKPNADHVSNCLLYTSPSPRDVEESRMPSSA